MKLSRKKKKIFRRIARVHFLLTVIAFGFYLSLSFFLGPKFLLSDLKDKFHALADDIITVSARVLAPPMQPVVSATSVCVTGAPRVNLDWADDDNTLSWNIERDGSPLVSGLVASSYADATVANTTSYSYAVTAYGPMGPGFATADPVSTTTLDCPMLQPTPALDIVTFKGINIATLGTLSTASLRPVFTGTTNIPNATIDILVNSAQVISDRVLANGTGYWIWTPATDLEVGDHTLTVTATDPLDGTRSIVKSILFTIEASNSGSHKSSGKGRKQPEASSISISAPQAAPNFPFDFTVQSDMATVYQGDSVVIALQVLWVDAFHAGMEAPVSYEMVSPDGKVITRVDSLIVLRDQEKSSVKMSIPLSVDPGKGYRIRATATLGKYVVSRAMPLSVLALPILSLGGGVSVTLPQVVAFSGWIALILLTLLLLWLFLFLREYWLYLHAWRHITERQLIRLGFFGMRKGVLPR